MKKALVYAKEINGRQIGDIERIGEAAEIDAWKHHYLSSGILKKIEVEDGADSEIAIFKIFPAVVGKWTKSGETDKLHNDPPMIDDGQGNMIIDDSWTEISPSPEIEKVITDAIKLAERAANNQIHIDRKAKIDGLKAEVADIENKTLAQLKPLIKSLVEIVLEA